MTGEARGKGYRQIYRIRKQIGKDIYWLAGFTESKNGTTTWTWLPERVMGIRIRRKKDAEEIAGRCDGETVKNWEKADEEWLRSQSWTG